MAHPEPTAGRARVPRGLRRAFSRLLRSVLPPPVDLVYSPLYAVDFGATPIDPRRAERVLAFLFSEGLVAARAVRAPAKASLELLRRVHDEAYLERLRHPGALTPVVGFEIGDDLTERALAAQRYATGGTVLATRLALERRRTAVNLGGGFHHAAPAGGQGFCIFNDVAAAVADARERGFDGPVLVVDLDLHDGNGTRRSFADDPTVFTFSIHNRDWDTVPATASLSIELSGEVGDRLLLETLAEHLPRLLAEHRPRLVYYLAGTDPAADDRLGNWRLSARGMLARDRYVVERVREAAARTPIVVLLAGGYGDDAWRYSARFLGWLLGRGAEIEPPTTEAITLARYREITRILGVRELAHEPGRDGSEDWEVTEDDVWADLAGDASRSRLLDQFSRHGVELVLERSGLLERLRASGFRRPTLEFDLGREGGDTVRLYSAEDRRELLMEVRLRRDRRALSGFEMLRLEWLLIQNPRAAFGPERTPLPGQKHPGLGLLKEAVALIILLAEQLGLDGILFVPSHYHLAATGKRYLRFVEPGDEAWFRAVDDAVSGLPLAEATAAAEAGRVVDRATGEPAPWRPMPMVLPLSEELERRVTSPDYEAAVERAASGLALKLAPS